MKRLFALTAAALLLTGCGSEIAENSQDTPAVTAAATEPETAPAAAEQTAAASTETETAAPVQETAAEIPEEIAELPAEEPTEWYGAENVPLPVLAPPDYAYVLDIPYYSQAEMPTGCELVSTSMLMEYYGYDISAYDLIDGGYIGVSLFEEDDDGELRGGDPNEVFIGDPFDIHGYGCYSGTIVSGLNSYLEGEPYTAFDLTGMSLPDICAEYIDCQVPVLIWATIGMVPAMIRPKNSWYIGDSGQRFTWVTNEHCLVLVGYDDDYYYFNDPLVGDAVPYGRTLTEQRFSEMGSQAACVLPVE